MSGVAPVAVTPPGDSEFRESRGPELGVGDAWLDDRC